MGKNKRSKPYLRNSSVIIDGFIRKRVGEKFEGHYG